MESHGSVRIMKRQSQHKTTGQPLWHGPLSARCELHSHPLAEQALACGRLTKAEGPEGPMAPIVTTGCSTEKTRIVRVILVPRQCLSSPYHTKKPQVMRDVLAQGPRRSFKPVTTFLESCVSSLCPGHANILRTSDCSSRIVRVIHVQGPR